MVSLGENRPTVPLIRKMRAASVMLANSTVRPTRSCDHLSCFWLGKRLPVYRLVAKLSSAPIRIHAIITVSSFEFRVLLTSSRGERLQERSEMLDQFREGVRRISAH